MKKIQIFTKKKKQEKIITLTIPKTQKKLELLTKSYRC